MRTGPLYERLKFVFPKYSEGQRSPLTGFVLSLCLCAVVIDSTSTAEADENVTRDVYEDGF